MESFDTRSIGIVLRCDSRRICGYRIAGCKDPSTVICIDRHGQTGTGCRLIRSGRSIVIPLFFLKVILLRLQGLFLCLAFLLGLSRRCIIIDIVEVLSSGRNCYAGSKDTCESKTSYIHIFRNKDYYAKFTIRQAVELLV